MLAHRLGFLFWLVSATAACRSDAEGSAIGGGGGGAGSSSGGGSGTTGGGSAGTTGAGMAGGGAAGAGSDGASDAGSDDGPSDAGSDGAPQARLSFGDLGGDSFQVLSSSATFTELPGDRAYVSIAINGWGETCDMALVCGEEQLNLTLHAIGGTRGDIQPGTYDVGGSTDGDVTYEVIGAAGRYDDACNTNGGFDPLASGTLTIVAIVGGRVQGEVDFTLSGGDTLSGAFDAVDCTQ